MFGALHQFVTSPSGSFAMLAFQFMILVVAVLVRRYLREGQIWWVIAPTFGWIISWLLAALALALMKGFATRLIVAIQSVQTILAYLSFALTVAGLAGWIRSLVLRLSNIMEFLEASAQENEGGNLVTVFEGLPDPRKIWIFYAGGTFAVVLLFGLIGAVIGGHGGAANFGIFALFATIVPGLWYTLLHTWYSRQRGILGLHNDVQEKVAPFIEASTNLQKAANACDETVRDLFAGMTVEMNEKFKHAKLFTDAFAKRMVDIAKLASTKDETQLLAVSEVFKEPISIREDFLQSVVQKNTNLVIENDKWVEYAGKTQKEFEEIREKLLSLKEQAKEPAPR